MITIDIPKNALRAVARFAADRDDVRFYLQGVLVQSAGTETRLIATNGNALAAYRHIQIATGNTGECNIIIPSAAIKAALASVPKSVGTVRIEIDGEYHVFVISGKKTLFVPIDGKFPNWQKIVPCEISGDAAQYDPDLLALCKRAKEDFSDGKCTIFVGGNGKNPGVIDVGIDGLVLLVMPWIPGGCADVSDIAWALEPLEKSEK